MLHGIYRPKLEGMWEKAMLHPPEDGGGNLFSPYNASEWLKSLEAHRDSRPRCLTKVRK